LFRILRRFMRHGSTNKSTGGLLFIADTNNHAVRVVDMGTGEVSTLQMGDL
jgi:hypothetical protein